MAILRRLPAPRRRGPPGARAGLGVLIGARLLWASLRRGWRRGDPSEQPDTFGGRWRPPAPPCGCSTCTTAAALLAEKAERQGDEFLIERQGRRESVPAATVVAGPEKQTYLLGTDHLGRDVFSRWLYATRISLAVGGLALLLACSLGIAVGAMAALGPPWLDTPPDAHWSTPSSPCPGSSWSSRWPPSCPPSATALVLAARRHQLDGVSRLARGQIKTLEQREFVLAARGLGVPPVQVFLRHILPNISDPAAGRRHPAGRPIHPHRSRACPSSASASSRRSPAGAT